MWDDLPQNSINKAILSQKTSKLGADTLNTSSNKLFLQSFELSASCDSLKMWNFDVFVWFQHKHYDENCNFIAIVLQG